MRRTTWAYAVAAVLVVALQSGWDPAEVRNLAMAMLVLIALIYAARGGRE
ncbi:hypothetical protein QF035_002285 [Streptomyces umbrinus]|uniref:Uncharacterized protein n=1 Tax=Streptomyces umbrinus TaxID=67370 RepID=A0ABU0SMC4_9ACTN|nr:hypothetical protein [Streptomyces umbrinus]MDQ1024703.1 hypothetical protein [Streptomyces umbrinus]